MAEELLFRVEGSTAIPTEAVTLEQAGLKERADLQEWVITHPEMIGDDVQVVTMEFARWTSAGGNQADRLDVLGLDADGTLVVVELKRDKAPDTVDMQAIKYAAMASRFTPESLAEEHARFLSQRGTNTSRDEALELLTTHAPDLSSDTLITPRIVLMARDFPPSVTATCVWLTEMGLDIHLVTFQAYRSHEQTLITVSRLFPVKDVEDFTISPRQAEVRQATEARKRTQSVTAVKRLVDAGAIPDGTEFTLAEKLGVNSDLHQQIRDWVDENEARGKATWSNDSGAPLTWEADQESYTPTGLATKIFTAATGQERAIQGTLWWADDEGRTLAQLAGDQLPGRQGQYQEFWTHFLDRLLALHPDWTSATSPSKSNWMDISGPLPGTRLGFSFAQNDRIRTEVYIDSGDRDANKALFDSLHDKAHQIETSVDHPIEWERLDNRRASRIGIYRPGTVGDTDDWANYVEWLIEYGERLRTAVSEAG